MHLVLKVRRGRADEDSVIEYLVAAGEVSRSGNNTALLDNCLWLI